jgi:hypothetical protein
MEEVYDIIKREAEKNPQYQKVLDRVENDPLYANASKATKGEERLAYLGEARGEKAIYADRSLWRKVMDYIRKALAKIFGVRSLPMTHETIQNLIDASIQSNFQRTGRPGEGVEGRNIRDAIAGIIGAARLDRVDEATTRLVNLRKAKEMERQNKDAKTIRLATEWERGADGKWRYEIQDNLQIIKEFPEIGENDYEFSNFTDYFNDDVLQNAYPELGKAKVLFVNDNNSTIAAYNQEAKIIKVNIKETLKQADTIITKKANILDTVCYQKLHDIIDQSTQQVGLLQLQMDKNKTKYLSDFSDKIEDPMICIQTPYDNILPTLTKGKQ